MTHSEKMKCCEHYLSNQSDLSKADKEVISYLIEKNKQRESAIEKMVKALKHVADVDPEHFKKTSRVMLEAMIASRAVRAIIALNAWKEATT